MEVSCPGCAPVASAWGPKRPRPVAQRPVGRAKVGEQLLGTWHHGTVVKVSEQVDSGPEVSEEVDATLRVAAEAEAVRMAMAFEAMAVYFQKLKPGALVAEVGGQFEVIFRCSSVIRRLIAYLNGVKCKDNAL